MLAIAHIRRVSKKTLPAGRSTAVRTTLLLSRLRPVRRHIDSRSTRSIPTHLIRPRSLHDSVCLSRIYKAIHWKPGVLYRPSIRLTDHTFHTTRPRAGRRIYKKSTLKSHSRGPVRRWVREARTAPRRYTPARPHALPAWSTCEPG